MRKPKYKNYNEDEFCDIASEVEDILSGFFIKETN